MFDTSFADVRIHVGPQPKRIGATAFTRGAEIYFAPGQYDPHTPFGQRLIGHELTHVVQQRAGRVHNPFPGSLVVVQDPGLEAEADRFGLRAVGYQAPARCSVSPHRTTSSPYPPQVQRMENPEDIMLEQTLSKYQGSFSMTSFFSRVGNKGRELVDVFKTGVVDTSTLSGYHGQLARRKLLRSYGKIFEQCKTVVSDPVKTLKILKKCVKNEASRREIDTSPANVAKLMAGFYSNYLAGVLVSVAFTYFTVGQVASIPSRRIVNKYVEPRLGSVPKKHRQIVRFGSKMVLKRFVFTPVIAIPVSGVELVGALGTVIRDGKAVKQDAPEFYEDLERNGLDSIAGLFKPVIEEIERQESANKRITIMDITDVKKTNI